MGWSMSLTTMPILRSSSSAMRLMSLIFIPESGNLLPVISEPRKKLRHTSIRLTTARSWYTVAMPCARDSRGEAK